jgi:hypothetical protein
MAHSNFQTQAILLAFANDDKLHLRHLNEELREIQKILRPAEKENLIKVIPMVAVTASDIIDAFLENRGIR